MQDEYDFSNAEQGKCYVSITEIEASALATQLKTSKSKRLPPASIAGKGRSVGDIVSPIADDEDWECLK